MTVLLRKCWKLTALPVSRRGQEQPGTRIFGRVNITSIPLRHLRQFTPAYRDAPAMFRVLAGVGPDGTRKETLTKSLCKTAPRGQA
jgi:hypothetical protein